MRFAGRITEWHDEKGYGFITPEGGGQRVFVHVRAIARSGGRPGPGMALTYAVARDERGRMNAVDARSQAPGMPRPARATRRAAKGLLALVALGALVLGTSWVGLPPFVPGGYLGLSLVVFIAYWTDKRAAQAGRRRTPESTLHLLALAGGWPGAMAAQHWLRHKSAKVSFLVVFWATVLLNLGALAFWIHEHRA